jgi:hypothetical protein
MAWLLGLDAMGAAGPLISAAFFDSELKSQFEALGAGVWKSSRIVAFRLDPCAGQTVVTDPSSCRSEIRLTAQYLDPGSGGVDAGLHLIYGVTRAELDATLAELLALKGPSDPAIASLPLGPHPIMVQQGLSGAFAKGANATLLRHVGLEKLVKITLISLLRSGNDWQPTQYEKKNGAFVRTHIPSLPAMTPDAEGAQFVEEVAPDPKTARKTHINDEVDPNLGYPTALLDSDVAKALPAADLQKGLDRLAAIEDPAKMTSATVDCASCHLAINARVFYENFTGVKAVVSFVAPVGQNTTRRDETGLTGLNIRMLGYRSTQLAVSQRVVNESARVAEWLVRGVR